MDNARSQPSRKTSALREVTSAAPPSDPFMFPASSKALPELLTITQLQAESGVPARALRDWVRQRLIPKPIGRGRAARYQLRHLLAARVVQHMRANRHTPEAIRARIGGLSEDELALIAPNGQQLPTPFDLVGAPPAPSYPSTACEMVSLMGGLTLFVDANYGPVVRRVAGEIYRIRFTRRCSSDSRRAAESVAWRRRMSGKAAWRVGARAD